MGRLRRRATIARNGITQILETAAEYGFAGEEWPTPGAAKAATSARRFGRSRRPEEMALGVESLERRQRSARERLESLLSKVESELGISEFRPLGAGKQAPPIYLQTKS